VQIDNGAYSDSQTNGTEIRHVQKCKRYEHSTKNVIYRKKLLLSKKQVAYMLRNNTPLFAVKNWI